MTSEARFEFRLRVIGARALLSYGSSLLIASLLVGNDSHGLGELVVAVCWGIAAPLFYVGAELRSGGRIVADLAAAEIEWIPRLGRSRRTWPIRDLVDVHADRGWLLTTLTLQLPDMRFRAWTAQPEARRAVALLHHEISPIRSSTSSLRLPLP